MLETRKHDCRDAFRKAAAGIDKTGKQASPISLRVTADERARLLRDAGDRTLSSYIRYRLFGAEGVSPSFRRKARKPHRPNLDQMALSRLLGLLGQSRLSSNMNQIAKAVHLGALPVSEDLERELHHACEDIREMRSLLLKALGKR